MEHIEDVSVVPCIESKFVQPFRIKYKQVTIRKVTVCSMHV